MAVRAELCLTVQQLIDRLTALPDKSMKVISAGCDCDGDVADVRIVPNYGHIGSVVVLDRYNGD